MPIAELYETGPDDLGEAMADLRHLIVEMEDKLATVFKYPASLPLYDYEAHNGTIKQRTFPHNGRVGKTPVAQVSFDGESLKLERHWYPLDEIGKKKSGGYTGKITMWHPDEPKVDDVLALGIEDSFWVCEVARLMPEMHERLIADGKIAPEELQEAAQNARAFLETLKED